MKKPGIGWKKGPQLRPAHNGDPRGLGNIIEAARISAADLAAAKAIRSALWSVVRQAIEEEVPISELGDFAATFESPIPEIWPLLTAEHLGDLIGEMGRERKLPEPRGDDALALYYFPDVVSDPDEAYITAEPTDEKV
jgi:hypothetical protein